MNEAAILTVRRNVDAITLPMVLELIEAQEWGPSAPRIPASEAKTRLARVTARTGDASDADAEVARAQETYAISDVDWTQIEANGSPEQTLAHVKRVFGM